VKGLEMAIEYHGYQKTISELQALYDNDQLNLGAWVSARFDLD